MKKILLAVAVLTIVVMMAGGAFAAILNPKIDVTATVQSKCTWIADGALTIAIDPAAAGVQTMTPTQPQVKCSKNKALAVSAASSGSGLTDATGSLGGTLKQAGYTDIPYTFTYAIAPVGNGFGGAADVNFSIAGSVAQAAAQAAEYSATNYTDTVTLTVTY
jgi:spore coat protein U-like protein